MLRFRSSLFTVPVALAASALVSGCGDAGNRAVVLGSATVLDRTTHTVVAGIVQVVHGTYTKCVGHDENQPWAVAVGSTAGADAGASLLLDVARDDPGCMLTVTSVDTSAGLGYLPGAPFVLAGAYQVAAVAFTMSGGGPVAFYANAQMTPADFHSNFVITILYSDDAKAVGTVPVPPPDYSVASVASITVVANTLNNVIAWSGSVNFIDGMQTGQDYVVVAGALPDSPATSADDATAFAAAGPPIAAGDPPSIPGSSFLAIGSSLPLVRTVIFRNTNTAGTVSAYQAIELNFNHP
jgi:hypothetical protein